MPFTSTDGQSDLPRYFIAVFDKLRRIKAGQLRIELPDGRVFLAKGALPGPSADLHIHNADVFARLIREGELGFCDAYLDDWWSSADLQAFMDLIHMGGDRVYDNFPGLRLLRAYENFRFWLQRNNRRQARKNISSHYDLGNEFYRVWLDDTMTYSSALFVTGEESLQQAQQAKYQSVVDQMGVKSGDHILEIGCGWGGFAEYAAREHGLRVTGLTISQQQFDFAVQRIEKAGLTDLVELRMQDYRDCGGQFDGVASIEMFEAVGEQYWPQYFQAVHDRLKPGARATLQIITIADNRWKIYRKGIGFIQKYIFPGGMLPCPRVLLQQIDQAGLSVVQSKEFGASYDRTLRLWSATFNARWQQITGMGFDERFRRMWNFYLTSCAASFKTGTCDVTQITVSHR
ncbi:MAG: class I SAM-dependent methyltransferase [Rhodobacteraceae bacterium]|nr:class I SAM-dependent methyltransferase [Paracoccaceae bacterium]